MTHTAAARIAIRTTADAPTSVLDFTPHLFRWTPTQVMEQLTLAGYDYSHTITLTEGAQAVAMTCGPITEYVTR
jgi:hypothetical protein